MTEILKWCAENAKWVFSGIGVLAISLLIGWGVARNHRQVIKGKSSGIQAGRDVRIGNDGEEC